MVFIPTIKIIYSFKFTCWKFWRRSHIFSSLPFAFSVITLAYIIVIIDCLKNSCWKSLQKVTLTMDSPITELVWNCEKFNMEVQHLLLLSHLFVICSKICFRFCSVWGFRLTITFTFQHGDRPDLLSLCQFFVDVPKALLFSCSPFTRPTFTFTFWRGDIPDLLSRFLDIPKSCFSLYFQRGGKNQTHFHPFTYCVDSLFQSFTFARTLANLLWLMRILRSGTIQAIHLWTTSSMQGFHHCEHYYQPQQQLFNHAIFISNPIIEETP